MTIGLAHFAPVSSGAVWGVSPYAWRSSGITGKTITWGKAGWEQIMANATLRTALRSAVNETLALRPYVEAGDFYALTPVTNDARAWAGYQFHAPELDGGSGFLMLFRRCQSPTPSFALSEVAGLSPATSYTLHLHHGFAADGARSVPDAPVRRLTGADLRLARVELPPCSAALAFYGPAR